MELRKLNGKELLKLLTRLVKYEQELKYRIRRKERMRIARRMKERNYILEEVAEMTGLELTEVEELEVNPIKEMFYNELRKEDLERQLRE